jgi:cytochrome b6-f complex iron-sulfur subunit
MSDKKPSTDDIFAKIRGGAKPAPAQQPASEPEEAASESPTPAKPAAAAPSGTADIMAAVRSGAAAKPAAKPEGGAAPKNTADILASLRSGGAAAPAAAAKPAAAKKKAAAAVDTSAAGGMSAAEMIKAARGSAATASAATGGKPAPGKVVLPTKPLAKPAAKAGQDAKETRRSALAFLLGIICSPVVWAWTSLGFALTASALATARFMMPNVLVEPPTKFKIGPPTDYAPGTVSTKWKAQFGVWIVNGEIDGKQMIYALSTVCTHLGCTPNWLEGEQKFKCPCHGSGFYVTGINFEGPAPRPLERMGIRLAEDGMLEVDKSVKFQRELGQWENAASFVPVT